MDGHRIVCMEKDSMHGEGWYAGTRIVCMDTGNDGWMQESMDGHRIVCMDKDIMHGQRIVCMDRG